MGAWYVYAQRPFGACEYRVELPPGVDANAITANMQHGVSSLIIPSPRRPCPRGSASRLSRAGTTRRVVRLITICLRATGCAAPTTRWCRGADREPPDGATDPRSHRLRSRTLSLEPGRLAPFHASRSARWTLGARRPSRGGDDMQQLIKRTRSLLDRFRGPRGRPPSMGGAVPVVVKLAPANGPIDNRRRRPIKPTISDISPSDLCLAERRGVQSSETTARGAHGIGKQGVLTGRNDRPVLFASRMSSARRHPTRRRSRCRAARRRSSRSGHSVLCGRVR